MKTIFSPAGVRQKDRFDSWHAAARQYVVDHDARPDCRLNFEAKLCSAALDDLNLVSFECSSMTISHTSRHAAHRDLRAVPFRTIGMRRDRAESRSRAGDCETADAS